MTYGHSGDLAVILTAYSLGKAAYQDGLPQDANPYKPSATELRDRWLKGWLNEQARDRTGKPPTPMPRSNADNPRPGR